MHGGNLAAKRYNSFEFAALHHLPLHCPVHAMAEGSAGYTTPNAARPRGTRSVSADTLRLTPNLHHAQSPVNPVNPGQESQEVMEVVQVDDSQVSQGQEAQLDQPDHADGRDAYAVLTESTDQTGSKDSEAGGLLDQKDSECTSNDADEDASSAAAASVSPVRAGANQTLLLREVAGFRADMVKSINEVGIQVKKLAEEIARSRSPAKHAKSWIR